MKLILLSGGVDSSTCLALAKETGDQVACVFFNYGQKSYQEEKKAAHRVSQHYGAHLDEIDLRPIFSRSQSSLVKEDLAISQGAYGDQEEEERLNTEVEFRNGIFIAILASLAMQVGADTIYYGAHQDEAGNIYPDCSPEFFAAMKEAVSLGTSGQVELNAPFLEKTKVDIVAKGKELGVPYDLTYSCYEGSNPPCGKCGTCIDRKKAFEANGLDYD